MKLEVPKPTESKSTFDDDKNNDEGKGEGEGEEKKPAPNCDNLYNGCSLTSAEKSSIIELTCDSVVKGNKDFGPEVVGIPNYELFIGKCPAGCDIQGTKKVFGVGIHPAESSVCKSALYDSSMPVVGGIIGIGI